MNSKKKRLEELLEKNLARTNDQVKREDASVKSILQRFRSTSSNSNVADQPDSAQITSIDINSQESSSKPISDPISDLRSDQPSTVQINLNPVTENPGSQQPGYQDPVIGKPGDNVTQPIINQVTEQPGLQTTWQPNNLATEEPGIAFNRVINTQTPGYRVPNFIDDEVIPTLSLAEQSVFRRLFRLSYGFNRNLTDSVSLSKIAEKCNLSVAGVKSSLKSLQMKRLIRVIGDNKYDPKGGNRYEVLPYLANEKPGFSEASLQQTRSLNNQVTGKPGYSETGLVSGSIKDHDHEDLNNTDHHQSETMMIYKKLTGNSWTRTDQNAYQKIRNISLDIIEQGIRITSQRATTRPNSLNYFVKEILNLAMPKATTQLQQRRVLERIVTDVRSRYVGSNKSYADFVEDIKRQAAREGVVMDNQLLNEILNRK